MKFSDFFAGAGQMEVLKEFIKSTLANCFKTSGKSSVGKTGTDQVRHRQDIQGKDNGQNPKTKTRVKS